MNSKKSKAPNQHHVKARYARNFFHCSIGVFFAVSCIPKQEKINSTKTLQNPTADELNDSSQSKKDVEKAISKIMNQQNLETGLELEIEFAESTSKILNTTDGTIGALAEFKGSSGKPYTLIRDRHQKIIDYTESKGEDGKSWWQQKWLPLPFFIKKSWLSIIYSSYEENRGTSRARFIENRQIYGLTTVSSVSLELDKPLKYFDNNHEAGTVELKLHPYLKKEVEFASPADLHRKLEMVELHFQSPLTASDSYRSVFNLVSVLKSPAEFSSSRWNMHVHMVQPKSSAPFQSHPFLSKFSLLEFFRRVNLVQEFLDVEHYGVSLAPQISEGSGNFNALDYDEFHTAIYSLFELSGAPEQDAKPRIGMRRGVKYNNDTMFGFEFRRIDRKSDRKILENTLNSIQLRLLNGEYGVSEKALRESLRLAELDEFLLNPQSFPTKMESNEEAEKTLERLGESLLYRERFGSEEKSDPEVDAAMRSFSKLPNSFEIVRSFPEVRYIMRNWNSDPVIFDLPKQEQADFLDKIRQARIAALKDLKNLKVRDTVIQFLNDSGLKKRFFDTLFIGQMKL